MKGYVDADGIAFLIVRVTSPVYSEQGIATGHFRILSIVFGDREKVERLHIKPDMIEMEVSQGRVIKRVPYCQGPAAQEASVLHRVGIKGGRVAEVGVLLQ